VNTVVVIDHVDKLELTKDEAEKYFNERRSLDYLARGLWFLYEQIQGVEAEVVKRLPRDKRFAIFGNAPEMRGIPQDLMACAFHWYAVTVCNYVKMVGWLVNNGDSKKATGYLNRVIPPVKLWRDKVGAHFARHSPRGENIADLAMSVMFPISFENDAFYAGSWTLTLGTGGKSFKSRQDMRWSLTHTHRDLISRYWPPKQT